MAFLEGSKMRIRIGTKEVFHETNSTLNASTEFKEIASKDTNGVEVSPGKQTFSLSSSAYAASGATTQEDLKAIADAWKAKTLVSVTLADGVTGNIALDGQGYIENFVINTQTEEAVTFDYSVKGSGDLNIGTTV
ncbi:phage tail tube protein [Tenacibaculum sp. Mcav3-52]|uniref:phage tail tube protein n=1 Tax=Tenacibaculum sp. Mcav3-52 TaxID=2917762 RepID=UPI001EF18A30|nr:phage tail tube protein [Tenacibaculum sp. Mcav3-52]MCG7502384.1 phage tail tube protein [Tenacibaculum sp. Mcav3-52]